MPPKKGSRAKPGKGKGKAKEIVTSDEEMHEVQVEVPKSEPTPAVMDIDKSAEQANEDSNASGAEGQSAVTRKAFTPQERVAKMAALREKMVGILLNIRTRNVLIIYYTAGIRHCQSERSHRRV